jgi:hypothetical protein
VLHDTHLEGVLSCTFCFLLLQLLLYTAQCSLSGGSSDSRQGGSPYGNNPYGNNPYQQDPRLMDPRYRQDPRMDPRYRQDPRMDPRMMRGQDPR